MGETEVTSEPETTDRLDNPHYIVAPKIWALLVGCFSIVLAGVLWGAFGEIVNRASGLGIVMVQPEGIHEIRSEDSAVVTRMHVRMGDQVARQDPLITLRYLSEESHAHDGVGDTPSAANTDAAREVTLLSPVAGVVEEISVAEGGSARGEHPLMVLVEPMRKVVEVVAFFPAVQGNNFRPGLSAQVAPSGVSALKYGTISGSIARLTYEPVPMDHVLERIDNIDLVREFFRRGVPVELEIALQRDPTTITGFAWSSGTGPPFPIKSGTLAEVTVIVERQSPFSLIWSAAAGWQ